MDLSLHELERVINYWRMLRPSKGEEYTLSPEVNALATVYAVMIFNRARNISLDTLDAEPRQLIDAWRRRQTHASA